MPPGPPPMTAEGALMLDLPTALQLAYIHNRDARQQLETLYLSALDVSAATLADFSCDDGDDLGFSYVLPTGPATAMVMSVRMGADPARSVVAPDGRCHDLDNVYVPDASLFPSSLLVNPQVTVYTMASYISDRILARA